MLEKRILIGTMDLDSDDRIIAQGDYRRALNFLNAKNNKDSLGAGEKSLGTREVSFSLPLGGNEVIGSYWEKTINKVFYFVYNDNNSHGIYQYDVTTEVITTVLQDSVLNFDKLYPILHIDYVDGKLFWTDGLNEPRYINVENAINGVYTYSTDQYIDAIQYAPLSQPSGVYGSDASKGANNLYGKLFQFRYQWVYDDNQLSAFSPISALVLPQSESSFIDQYALSSNNNLISVSFNSGIDKVKKVRLAVREGNTTDWYLVREFVKSEEGWSDNALVSFDFYNDEIYTALDQSDTNRLFDYIPLKAEAQAIIDGNRIAYGNVTDGYDNIQVDATVEVIYNEPPQNPQTRFYNVAGGSLFPPGGDAELTISPTSGSGLISRSFVIDAINVQQGDQFIFNKSCDYTGINTFTLSETYTYNAVGGESSGDIALWLVNQINTSGTFNTTRSGSDITASANYYLWAGTKMRVEVAFTHYFTTLAQGMDLDMSIRVTNLANYVTLKRAAKHSLGIVYRDRAGRVGAVQTSKDLDFLVSPFSDTPGYEGICTPRITINHTPPAWAEKYQIVYSGNLTTSDFIYAKISNISFSASEYSIYLTDTGIPEGFAKYNADNNQKTSLNYEWAKGDRIWFIKDSSGNYRTQYVDVEINHDGTFSGGYYIGVDINIPVIPAVGDIVQIYTPNKSVQEKFYYEVSETFDIVNGYHSGNTQDQDATLPAILDLNIGDTYYRYRNSIYDQFVEDGSFSDYYTSNYWSKGRPNIVDKNYKQVKRGTTIFYSQPYIPETNINGLSTIYDSAFESYPISYGEIKRLYSDGQVLEVYQRLRTGQVPINRDVLYNADGTPNGVVGQANAVMGQINYFAWRGGIGDNPESFTVYGDRRYHVDVANGMVMRLGNDGYTAISEYKAHKYFNDLFRDLQTANSPSQYRIISTYDFRRDQFILAVKEVRGFDEQTVTVIPPKKEGEKPTYVITTTPGKTLVDAQTIAFSEEKKGWTTFYSFRPENMVMTAGNLITFSEGKLYIHDSTSYNQFYGVDYDTEVTVVFNENPSNQKFFIEVRVDATDIFSCPDITNSKGQTSELSVDDFEEWEGVYYAALLRDSSTPNISNPLFEGDELRDHSLIVKFSNTGTDYARLFAVGCIHSNSELTNR